MTDLEVRDGLVGGYKEVTAEPLFYSFLLVNWILIMRGESFGAVLFQLGVMSVHLVALADNVMCPVI